MALDIANSVPLSCGVFEWTFREELLSTVLGPIVLVLLVVFAAYVHGGAKARARDDGGRRRSSVAAARQALRDHGPQFRRNLVAVTILVTYLVLPSVTTTIFRTYDCETVDDPDGEGKKRYLRVRHDTRCEGRAYRLTAIFAGLACVIWPVGVPLLYICELAYHRAKINHCLGGPGQTSNLSSSVKSKSIRLIFGRIDCSHRVLEAQKKTARRNCQI